jgi:predicted ferric reductase
VAPGQADGTPDPGAERTLSLAGYVFLVLAPLALMAVVVKPGNDSFGTIVAAGIGFAGLTILVLQIVTASRVRAFTAPFGIDLLLRFHRQIGVAALALVVAHVVVLIADDPSRLSLLDPTSAPWRSMAGLASIVALLLLTLTSIWRADLGLSYEVWRAVHLLLGAVVIGFAFAHVVGVSRYLSIEPIRWVVLLFIVLGAVALFWRRVGRPLGASRRPFRVSAVRPERGGAVTLELAANGSGGLRFEPGQFVWIKSAERAYGLTENPFSLSSSARRPERPELTMRQVGDFTRAAAELEPGTELVLDGPHGSFRPMLDGGFVLLCAGIGITPAMSLLRTLADDGDRRAVLLVYGNRTWDDVIFHEEIDELQERLDLTVVHVLSAGHDEWTGERGRIDEPLLRRALPPDAGNRNVFVCGSDAMVDDVLAALHTLDIPRGHVHAERFASV